MVRENVSTDSAWRALLLPSADKRLGPLALPLAGLGVFSGAVICFYSESTWGIVPAFRFAIIALLALLCRTRPLRIFALPGVLAVLFVLFPGICVGCADPSLRVHMALRLTGCLALVMIASCRASRPADHKRLRRMRLRSPWIASLGVAPYVCEMMAHAFNRCAGMSPDAGVQYSPLGPHVQELYWLLTVCAAVLSAFDAVILVREVQTPRGARDPAMLRALGLSLAIDVVMIAAGAYAAYTWQPKGC